MLCSVKIHAHCTMVGTLHEAMLQYLELHITA